MTMRGVSKLKSIILVLIMGMVVILGILGMDTIRTYMSGASADYQPSEVGSSVASDGKSAVINWITTKDSLGYIEYGTTPASLLLRSEIDSASPKKNHSITLSPLKANMNYYYRIRVGDDESKKSGWEVFDNGGIPYSFNTKIGGGSAVPTVSQIPSVSPVATPDYTGGDRLIPSGVPSPLTSQTEGINCLTGVDYNHDGVINSLDYITCLKGQVTKIPPMPTLTPTVSAASSGTGQCKTGVDYDGNGVINSLDMVRCLQVR